jgi:hypothetical protein
MPGMALAPFFSASLSSLVRWGLYTMSITGQVPVQAARRQRAPGGIPPHSNGRAS